MLMGCGGGGTPATATPCSTQDISVFNSTKKAADMVLCTGKCVGKNVITTSFDLNGCISNCATAAGMRGECQKCLADAEYCIAERNVNHTLHPSQYESCSTPDCQCKDCKLESCGGCGKAKACSQTDLLPFLDHTKSKMFYDCVGDCGNKNQTDQICLNKCLGMVNVTEQCATCVETATTCVAKKGVYAPLCLLNSTCWCEECAMAECGFCVVKKNTSSNMASLKTRKKLAEKTVGVSMTV